MGQSASSILLSLDDVLKSTELNILEPQKAIADLNLIAIALEPRTNSLPTPPPFPPQPPFSEKSALLTAFYNALAATYNQSFFIFAGVYRFILPSDIKISYGTELNYAPVLGDHKSLTKKIAESLAEWGFKVELANDIASQLQPEVMMSENTPLSTYGRVATGNVIINDPFLAVEYLFWVAAFGLFQTGIDGSGQPTYGIVYAFTAANGLLQATVN